MTIRNGPSAGCDPNPHPCQPSPKGLSSRPAHRPYRGLLSVHSRCGLHTRAVTNSWPAIRRLQPFRYLHDCSGCFRLERLPGGTYTHWKAPPCHGAHPSRTLATSLAIGQIQRVLNERLPDIALSRIIADVERAGQIGPEEKEFLEQAFRREVAQGGQGFSFTNLIEPRTAGKVALAGGPIAYYAGAVSAIFLLFAAMQGAASLLDERQSGIHARLLAGPGGLRTVVLGKFVFLTAQGFVQVVLIYSTATFVYGVDVLTNPLPWAITCLLTAAMAAGVALAISAMCRTRQQAQMVSTFGVLVLSAVGGSMVPRFLMPPWLQSLCWWTPNAWTIETLQLTLH